MDAVSSLIPALDEAVARSCDEAICAGIKGVLESRLSDAGQFLPDSFCAPAPNRYARRLLHRDPRGRYSIIVMVWGVGQETELHDHAGQWCVEGVYRGRIKVTNFELQGRTPQGLHRFRRNEEIIGRIGEAGALIPPYEYHVIANDDARPSVTIHVYKGEMRRFSVFVPEDGGYRRETRDTYYTV